MATAPALLSIDEYLHTSYSPDVHFVEGILEERNVGEFFHARIQSLIAHIFVANEDSWQAVVLSEQRIRVTSDDVRICDIAILRADAPYEPVTTTPPLICIEILSPEDRLARAKLVLADYLAMGVPNIWLIDPIRRAAYTFDAAGLHEADPAILTVPATAIALDVTALFTRLDARIGAR